MRDATTLEAALAAAKGTIVVSGAPPRELLEPAAPRVSARPVVRGRTVWAAGAPGDVAVVEWPNRYGLYDERPDAPSVILVRPLEAPLPMWATDAGVVAVERRGRGAEAPPFESRTQAARRLGKHLTQLSGVTLPFGEPESPRFVVSFGVPTDALVAALDLDPTVMRAEALEVPGVPSAVCFEVRDGGVKEMAAVSAEIASALDRAGGDAT